MHASNPFLLKYFWAHFISHLCKLLGAHVRQLRPISAAEVENGLAKLARKCAANRAGFVAAKIEKNSTKIYIFFCVRYMGNKLWIEQLVLDLLKLLHDLGLVLLVNQRRDLRNEEIRHRDQQTNKKSKQTKKKTKKKNNTLTVFLHQSLKIRSGCVSDSSSDTMRLRNGVCSFA